MTDSLCRKRKFAGLFIPCGNDIHTSYRFENNADPGKATYVCIYISARNKRLSEGSKTIWARLFKTNDVVR